MIKIVEGNLFYSNANFLVHQVNCMAVMRSGVAKQVSELYPHVEREYLKYCKHCKKNKVELLGTVQYVPVDDWALVMCNTMNNKRVEVYDNQYQYIVNLFGQNNYGYDGEQYTDLKALRKGFVDIRDKAKIIGAKVAMPYGIASVRGGCRWEDVYAIIKDVFENSGVDVEICKYDRG